MENIPKNSYVIADGYHEIRPMMAVSVLNLYRQFFLSLFPKQYNNYLQSIYIVLGIITSPEMI